MVSYLEDFNITVIKIPCLSPACNCSPPVWLPLSQDFPPHGSTSFSFWNRRQELSDVLKKKIQLWESELAQLSSHSKQGFCSVTKWPGQGTKTENEPHLSPSPPLFTDSMRGYFKISSDDLHSLNSCSAQKMKHLEAFITLSKSLVAPACPPMKSLISFQEEDKAVLEQSCFSVKYCAVFVRTSDTSRCPSNMYPSIVSAQIFSKQLTENRLQASDLCLKGTLETCFMEEMSRLHF